MRVTTAGQLAQCIAENGAACQLVGDSDQLVGPKVVTDTRQVEPGSLFVGIAGEHVDGAEFSHVAASRGAAATLIGRNVDADLPQLIVSDPVAGLGALAKGLVKTECERGLVTFAITGSSGKTSTKDLLAQILETQGQTVSPVGNHNNEIGVPLTAVEIDDTTQFLVSEMGARAKGDVAHLCSIAPPQISTVLNVGTAHLGEFGSREAIAQAKGEIFEALPPEGWAVLNADDVRVNEMDKRTSAHIARWTTRTIASPPGTELMVWAKDIAMDALQRASFTLLVENAQGKNQYKVILRLIGEHQVFNAVAAATMAIAAGIGADDVVAALNNATTRSPLRMELHESAAGVALINDSYNANPDSMAAAVRTLAAMGEQRRHEFPDVRTIAVLGEMAELGPDAPRLHANVATLAAQLGIDEVIAVGEYAGVMVEAVSQAGGKACSMVKSDVASHLNLHSGDIVLVKASRVMALEDITAELLANDAKLHKVAGKEESPR